MSPAGAAAPLVALSIDLDALGFYLQLHAMEGADRLDEDALAAIPGRAAQRFGELCAELGAPGTAFVVGRDVEAGHGLRELRALGEAGHELASHSHAHDYALSRGTPEEIEADLARAEAAIGSLGAPRPVGFRAPGYNLSPALLAALERRGYLYDSSLLPSPPYYALKVGVIAALALAGRRSRSVIGDPRQLFRPRRPHRWGGLVELPVAVLPGLRVPYIGTSLTLLPGAVSAGLARGFAADPLVVIELHGVDLCDRSDGIPEALLARRADMRLPLATKRARLLRALRPLFEARRPVTLAQAARLFPGAPGE